MLKLYQFPISHFSEKVRWALDYKGIPYQKVNLIPGPHIKVMLKLTGRTSVPAIDDQGQIVFESSQILNYLDDTYPQKLLTPESFAEKSQASEWEKFADEEIGVHVRRICYHTLLDEPQIVKKFFTQDGPWYGPLLLFFLFPKLSQKMRKYMDINEEAAEQSKHKLALALEKVQHRIKERSFLVGDNFSRADLAVASLLGPMIQPAKYGLKWPRQIPKPLQEYIDGIQSQLLWSRNIYNQFR